MMQPNEKGTQKDLVLYRIETSKSDIKTAELLLAAKKFRICASNSSLSNENATRSYSK